MTNPVFIASLLQIKSNKRFRKTSVWSALFLALTLIILVFPDVIFGRATLTLAGLYNGNSSGFWEDVPLKRVSFGNPPYRIWSDEYYDFGGSVWQSEPAAMFTRYTIEHRESPYWNRFSASGQFGLQTLADIKYSFQTILIAILGGSQYAFHLVFLGMAAAGVTALIILGINFFHCSRTAAFVGSVVFLLNGFVSAALFENVQQVYFFFPVELLALCAFCIKPSVIRFLLLTGASVIVFADTFVPTTLLMMLICHTIAAAFAFTQDRQRFFAIIGLQILASMTALLLLLPVYLPIWEAFQSLGSAEIYNNRPPIFVAAWYSVLSLFTPFHFWDEFRAFSVVRSENAFQLIHSQRVFHFGIITLLLSACAIFVSKHNLKLVVLVTGVCLLLGVGRVFGFPGSQIFSYVPFIKSIGHTYCYMAVSICVVILSIFGFDESVSPNRKTTTAALLMASAAILCAFYLYSSYGLRITPFSPSLYTTKMFLVKDAIFLLLGILSIFLASRLKRKYARFAGITIAILLFWEMSSYQIHDRCIRREIFNAPPAPIAFMQARIGDGRVACLGNYLLPPEFGSAFQLPQIESLNMNGIPSYNTFFATNFLPHVAERWGQFPTFQLTQNGTEYNKTALDFLAVKFIVVAKYLAIQHDKLLTQNCREVFKNNSLSILQNDDVFPRVFAVHQICEGAVQWPSSRKVLRECAYTHDQHLLQACKKVEIPIVEHPQSVASEVGTLVLYKNELVELKISLSRAAVLVFVDNYHPCWTVTDNGNPVYLGKVDDTFRGIVLPAGEHIVQMKFEPLTLKPALIIACATALSLFLILFYTRRIHIRKSFATRAR